MLLYFPPHRVSGHTQAQAQITQQMRIKNTNPATEQLYDEELMAGHYDPPGIMFAENGTARVLREVGEALVASARYPSVEAVEDDDGSEEAETADTESDAGTDADADADAAASDEAERDD